MDVEPQEWILARLEFRLEFNLGEVSTKGSEKEGTYILAAPDQDGSFPFFKKKFPLILCPVICVQWNKVEKKYSKLCFTWYK